MKIDRLLGIIIYLLNHESVTAKLLAEKYEVSVRTIQRDMESISMAGVPIIANTGSSGGYSILPKYRIENQFVKKDDFNIILMALKSLNTGYESKQLENIVDKYLSLAGTYSQNVFLDYSVTKENERVQKSIPLIEQSIKSQVQINFEYRSPDGYVSHRLIQPLALRFKWYAWYLFGFDMDKKDYRTFKVTRMNYLEASTTKFHNTEDIEALLQKYDKAYLETCENIEVWCRQDSINLLDEYFPEEKKEAFGDGHYIMHLHVPPNELLWQALLLSMGDKIKIIKPEYYQRKLIETAEKFLSNYDI
jgi:predicted DNA-binding transcriptional regulator YafY